MTPVSKSLAAQTTPAIIGFCDPGIGPGYRMAFYGPGGAWDEIAVGVIPTMDQAMVLIRDSERVVAEFMGRIHA